MMSEEQAIRDSFISPNVSDSNGEPANVVDAIASLTNGARAIRDAITPNIIGGTDASGGHVESLTEACMGITAGLCRIAEAIDGLADAVREQES